MPIPQHLRKPGTKFTDTSFKAPDHRRVFTVEAVLDEGKRLQARSVALGTKRFVNADDDGLRPVPTFPDLHSNLDCLVGEKVRMHLCDGGTAHGVVTGVIYSSMDIDGKAYRQIKSIELDRSRSTTWEWSEVFRIESL